eukprot:TRINITY_DN4947_c0_g1_i2.p1 TRINITY_DN4947_c0_g1~~TRINITY_DN4947_c0_g1_i2.p1  ORF type:complete len:753 (-),score=93.50 TRINITY_DN4947_c0_g1_i2:25-2283(-)
MKGLEVPGTVRFLWLFTLTILQKPIINVIFDDPRTNNPVFNDSDPPPIRWSDVNGGPVAEVLDIDQITSSTVWLQDFPSRVKEFVLTVEERVKTMVQQAQKVLLKQIHSIDDCKCVYNRCSNTIASSATCGYGLGSDSICGTCEGIKYTTETGYAAIATDIDPQNMTIAQKNSLCLMSTFDEIIPKLKELETTTWTYMGFSVGAQWTYPGRARHRDLQNGSQLWNYCDSYDPRARPWYNQGATGPLDIVLVIDKSNSMKNTVDGDKTRWSILRDTILKFIDTFTFTNYINIVTFNERAKNLYVNETHPLLQGTFENREMLKKELETVQPKGSTNFEKGIDEAFRILTLGSEKGVISSCNKVIFFLTDGEDNQIVENKPGRAQEIFDKVEQWQNELVNLTDSRARIFTFSIDSEEDDTIVRQLACRNEGAWAPIRSTDDPLAALLSYLNHIGAGRDTTRYYWTQPYEDASNLGQVMTIVMPVYWVGGDLFGVAAHDVLVEDIQAVVGKNLFEEFIEAVTNGSKSCDQLTKDRCKQQQFRGAYTQCPDIQQQQFNCSKFEDKYYFKGDLQMWEEAQDQCNQMNGTLASANTAQELAFLAGLADPQGSWISLHTVNNRVWSWLDSMAPSLNSTSTFWSFEEPSDYKGKQCGSISPSGMIGNLKTSPCNLSLTFICEFENEYVPSDCKTNFFDANEVQKEMPSIDECPYIGEGLQALLENPIVEELEAENLFCDWKGSKIFMSDVIENLICCDECQ